MEKNIKQMKHLKSLDAFASLRRAPVQFGVLQCKDVNSAFITGGTQEGGVVAEVYTGEVKEKKV